MIKIALYFLLGFALSLVCFVFMGAFLVVPSEAAGVGMFISMLVGLLCLVYSTA